MNTTSQVGEKRRAQEDFSTSRSTKNKPEDKNYYGPGGGEQQWGVAEDNNLVDGTDTEVKYKPNFGLTGALAKDENTGNSVNGIVLKFSEPLDSVIPVAKWRFYIFKDDKIVETLHLHRQSAFLAGRDARVAHIVLAHPSCSKQHAVIQFRKVEQQMKDGSVERVIRPYIMDLVSTHKTFINGTAIDDSRYYELRANDCVKFGGSSREYILMLDTDKHEDD